MKDWELVDYSWDLNTGVATLTYERERRDTGETETKIVKRADPKPAKK